MRSLVVLLASLLLPVQSAPGSPVTMRFSGHVTSKGSPFREGAVVTGYFTFDPALQPEGGIISSVRTNMVVEIPEAYVLLEMTSYSIAVRNDWGEFPQPARWDYLEVLFNHPLLQFGNGGLFFVSSDLSLVSGTRFPTVFPPLERFDVGHLLHLSYESESIEWDVACLIDEVTLAPGQGARRPVIYGFGRDPDGIQFRFSTQPAVRYTVEFKESPGSGEWRALTNVVGRSGIFSEGIVYDTPPSSASRFYRARRILP